MSSLSASPLTLPLSLALDLSRRAAARTRSRRRRFGQRKICRTPGRTGSSGLMAHRRTTGTATHTTLMMTTTNRGKISKRSTIGWAAEATAPATMADTVALAASPHARAAENTATRARTLARAVPAPPSAAAGPGTAVTVVAVVAVVAVVEAGVEGVEGVAAADVGGDLHGPHPSASRSRVSSANRGRASRAKRGRAPSARAGLRSSARPSRW